jgi:hypothetical protein
MESVMFSSKSFVAVSLLVSALSSAHCGSPSVSLGSNNGAIVGEPQQQQGDPGQPVPVAFGVSTKRSYWLIYPNSEAPGTYYMMPRPDGAEEIVKACADAVSPDAPFFRQASLCESASSSAAVQKVNRMQLADAERTSTFLHARLKFRAIQVSSVGASGYSISPYWQERDLLAICSKPGFDKGTLKTECDRAKATSKNDIAYVYTQQEAELFAKSLNELYGIAH